MAPLTRGMLFRGGPLLRGRAGWLFMPCGHTKILLSWRYTPLSKNSPQFTTPVLAGQAGRLRRLACLSLASRSLSAMA